MRGRHGAGPHSPHLAMHRGASVLEKCAVYGAFDGTMAASGVIAAGAAVGLPPSTLLALAFSSTIALGAALAVRVYLQYTSDQAFYARERRRELWELKNFPEGEVAEMTELLVGWGVAEGAARSSMTTLSVHTEFFTDLMMALELRMQAPTYDPLHNAVCAAVAFAAAGSIPCGALLMWEMGHPALPLHWRTAALVVVVLATACLSTALLVGMKSRLLPYRSRAWAGGMAIAATAAASVLGYFLASHLLPSLPLIQE